MSRTLKDKREMKVAHSLKQEKPIHQKYRKFKQEGSYDWGEDLCPECGGITDFQNGFLTCTECNWSTFETEDLMFNPFHLKEVI